MLRSNREITDKAEIIDVLRRCDTIRIGLYGDDFPYVVPVSFGVKVNDDIAAIYFHGAVRGYKTELLAKNPKVCIEGDIFYKVEPWDHGITARYESVIGFGDAEAVSGEEKVIGLKAILEHYNFPNYPIEQCKGLEATAVYKITVLQITGKRNIGYQ